MYSFIRNDKNSFMESSRVYEVYDESHKLLTCLVVGYDFHLDKYYICQCGQYILENVYQLNQDEIKPLITINAIYLLINLLTLLDVTDIVNKKYQEEYPDITPENFILYISSVEPKEYNDEIDEYEGIYAECDYDQALLDNDIAIPEFIENCNADDDYIIFDYYELTELYLYDSESDISLYCSIDMDKLEAYCFAYAN